MLELKKKKKNKENGKKWGGGEAEGSACID